MENTCKLAKEWQQSHPSIQALAACVNFSARQLEHPDSVHIVEEILGRTLVAEMTNVGRRTVGRWVAGETKPRDTVTENQLREATSGSKPDSSAARIAIENIALIRREMSRRKFGA